ncbi:MAG: hypothetical protein IKY33_01650 [Clostridia bacterium]|nr:hypothetical protein [Clostridia bacterium]
MKKTFLLGALGYGLLEILWRGYTHWSMLLTGGACLCGMRRICRSNKGILHLAARCAVLITAAELGVGLLVNRKKQVWDYSRLRGNLSGQICPQYSALWFALSLPIVLYYKRKKRRGAL